MREIFKQIADVASIVLGHILVYGRNNNIDCYSNRFLI